MTLQDVGVETWFAAAYCVLLTGLGHVIDAMARRAAASAEGGASFGFVYHPDHDAWQCPEDQWLWPTSFDPDHRVMRYRGRPTVCNACPVKDECTPSVSGREVQRAVDPWPASEAARFHRGIACAIVLMGLVWPLATLATSPGSAEVLVLVTAVAVALLASLPLWSHLRRTAVVLPDQLATAHLSLDDTLAQREVEAAAVLRRRSRFGSDRRTTKGGTPW